MTLLQISTKQMAALAAAKLLRSKAAIYREVRTRSSLSIDDYDWLFARAWQLGFKDFDALVDVVTAAALTRPGHREFFGLPAVRLELELSDRFPQRVRARRLLNMVQGDG